MERASDQSPTGTVTAYVRIGSLHTAKRGVVAPGPSTNEHGERVAKAHDANVVAGQQTTNLLALMGLSRGS